MTQTEWISRVGRPGILVEGRLDGSLVAIAACRDRYEDGRLARRTTRREIVARWTSPNDWSVPWKSAAAKEDRML